jgi:hypothetical protein
MDSFYLIVVAIAVFILILCLTGVGILMGYQNANLTFPPSANTCPDGWTSVGTTCTAPDKPDDDSQYSIVGVSAAQGFKAPNQIDMSKWTDKCEKKKWANMYNINWDGISNYTKC